MYRHHKELISSSTTTSTIHESANPSPIPVISDDIPDMGLQTTMPSYVDISVDDDPLISQQKVSGLFLLKMRETFSVSQAAIDDIVAESESVFEHVVSKLRVKVKCNTRNVEWNGMWNGMEWNVEWNFNLKCNIHITQLNAIQISMEEHKRNTKLMIVKLNSKSLS